jgi:hypothetical protein
MSEPTTTASLTQQQVPTDPAGRSLVGPAAVLLAVAAAHQFAQNGLISNTVKAVLSLWNGMRIDSLSEDWRFVGPRAYGYVSAAQEMVAAEAAAYVQHALAVQGIEIPLPPIVPREFAGATADGRSLEGLLVGGVVSAKNTAARGGDVASIRASGAAYLTTVIKTEITDAGTVADQVALVAAQRTDTTPARADSGTLRNTEGRKVHYGWVRMLTPPSCGRCVLLAGKFYKWNDGFERHPNCDCRHIPVEESLSSDVRVDPERYFRSLTIAQQERYFGVANSAAIAAGGDFYQVMNAALRKGGLYTVGKRRYTREGTTRRGFYRSTTEAGRARQKRPTPYQIMKDARGDQAAAVRLLRQFGYVVN